MSRLQTHDDAILKLYGLSSLQPQHWSNSTTTDGTDDVLIGKSDEPDPLGLMRGGILRRGRLAAVRPRVLLQSKGFDPKTFLATIHPTATFKDLNDGHDRLEAGLKQRSEALKVLVEQEFDRFASVKGATMAVFDEMKEGPLADGSDYGVKSVKESLTVASTRAEQVYNPILDARLKADRLRSTLGVFERNKFFFNLPGTLLEAVEAGRYDTALNAYKKGRYVAEYRAAQLLGRPASAAITPAQEEQARRIIDKVWTEVERIIADLRTTLAKRLRDPRLPMEEVERTVDILGQLKPTEDPVWVFFDTRHQHMLQSLKTAQTMARARFQAVMDKHGSALTEAQHALALRPAVTALALPEHDAILASAPGAAVWRSALEAVKAISEAVMASLPSFWRLSKGYIDGKYQRGTVFANQRTPQDCRAMTSQVVQAFASAIVSFFELDKPPAAVSDEGDHPALPDFAPPSSHALTTAHYLLKILVELTECANDLGGVGLLKADVTTLKDLLARARSKFVDTLASTWVRDAKAFYRLESWQPDADEPLATVYVRQAAAFQRSIARSCMRLAGASEDRALAAFPSLASSTAVAPARREDEVLPNFLVTRAQAAFLDALYAFLDGLVHVAFSAQAPPDAESSHGLAVGTEQRTRSRAIDVTDVDTRILLTVSNLASLKAGRLAAMVQQFEKAFSVNMAADLQMLTDVVGQLDKILFDDLIKRKSEHTARVIQHGILGSDVDWASAPKPTAVHAYVYDCLLSLVLVHAHVSAVAPSLVSRTLSALVDELARDALACFAKIERFGMGGMLQATLEIEFLHQTLTVHVTPQADATLQDIYKTISQAYYRKPSSDGAAELQTELEQLKKTLIASRKATTLDFLCFRGESAGRR